MGVKVIYRDKSWEVRSGLRVREAIREVGLDPQAVLAMREGKLLTEDVVLRDGDEVKLIAVVSGG